MSRFFGALLLVAGTTIGAGTLALPMAVAELGFIWASVAIFAMWALMYYTSLLTLELNFAYGSGQSLGYLANWLFGRRLQIFTTGVLVYLFYVLLAAYIAGGTSIIKTLWEYFFKAEPSVQFLMIGFTSALALVIALKTCILDYGNRFFFCLKMVLFLGMVFMLYPVANLENLPINSSIILRAIPLALPVIFTSFGFHGSIPSLINFCNKDLPTLKRALLWGSLLPAALYIVWLGLTVGVLSLPELLHAKQQGFELGKFVQTLGQKATLTNVHLASWGFALLAIVTSFLGVGWGLFDFFQEFTSKASFPKWKASLLTFLLPLLIAGLYPKAFIAALGFAAIALSILAVILPVALVIQLRRKVSLQRKTKSYETPGGIVSLSIVGLIGIGVIVLEVINLLS